MSTVAKQPIDQFDTDEHWFPVFFVRVLLVSVLLTAMLLFVGIQLISNH